MKKTLLSLLWLAGLTSFVASCNNDDATPAPAQASVRIIHASPDAPAVDVRVNGSLPSALTNVPFPGVSDYLTVNAGTTRIQVSPTGTTTNVIDATANLESNKAYSVFAINRVASIGAALVTDDLTTPAAGKAHVRFFHFSPDAPAVDIVPQGSTTALFSNRSFNDQFTNVSFQNFTPVDAGTVTLNVRVNGSTTIALSVPNITLQAGKIYTIFARGLLNGSGNQALNASIITHN
ncbi:MAG: DUF4397 domain-containing protein [Chitinophagaceae bacterium]|jgi:hypothetical protein